MRLVFAGTPAAALPSLEALLASSHELVAVLTRPDAPAGRGRQLRSSPVAQRAREAGLEVLTPERPRDPEFLDRLSRIAADCCPVVAYGALIPPAALAIPAHGWVNLHFSLLPAWRGAAPVQHAVLHGDEVTGASVFQLEAGLDTGPVYGVVTELVRPTDTAGDLLDRLARSGAGLLRSTLDGIERGDLVAIPQPAVGVSLAPRLDPADVQVDWTAPAVAVDRLVRAATPAPGPWTTYDGGRLKLGPVRPVVHPGGGSVPDAGGAAGGAGGAAGGASSAAAGGSRAAGGAGGAVGDARRLAPGEIHVAREAVLVGTGTGPVRLGQVQPEGRGAMTASDWARGARLAPGARLS